MPTQVTTHEGIDWVKNIILQSNDQPQPVEFLVNKEAAKMSGLIMNLLEDTVDAAADGDASIGATTAADDCADASHASVSAASPIIIPVSNINGRTLTYVLQYIEYHWNNRAKPIEKPLRTKIQDYICDWDKQFLFTELIKNDDEKQHEALIDVIMAANFMNVKDLLELTCAAVASMIKGKSPSQIRALFNIENDFTPEEEQRIMEENHWCEEV